MGARLENDGRVVRTHGFGIGLRTGDFIGLAGPEYAAGNKNASSNYKITELEYMADPPDMWKAVLVYDKKNQAPPQFASLTLDQVFFTRSDR